MLGSYTAEGLQKTNNLSDLANAATARTNLGLGSAAAATVGNSAGDLPALQSGGVFPQAVIPPDVSEFNTIFVCTGGNDSTAKAYSRMYPFATIGAALAVAQPGDLVSVSAGCFDLGAGNLFVPSGVNVKGSGNCHGNISLVGSGTAADGNFTGPVPDAFSMTPQAAGGFATYNGFPYLFGVQQNWYIWNNGGGNWILSQTLGSLTASSYWKSSGADINGTYALNLVAGDAATGTAQIELTGGTIICSTRPSSGAGASSSGAVMTFGGANLISDLCIFAMAGTLSSASACNAIGATASTDDTIPAADVYFQNFSAHASRTAFSLTDAPPSDLFATVAWHFDDCQMFGMLRAGDVHLTSPGSTRWNVYTHDSVFAGYGTGATQTSPLYGFVISAGAILSDRGSTFIANFSGSNTNVTAGGLGILSYGTMTLNQTASQFANTSSGGSGYSLQVVGTGGGVASIYPGSSIAMNSAVTSSAGVINNYQQNAGVMGSAVSTGNTAALSGALAYKPPSPGLFRIGGVLKLASDTTDVLNVQAIYKDENSTSQTLTFTAMNPAGTISTAIGTTTGVYCLVPRDIYSSGGNVIDVNTVLQTGGGSTNYDLALSIEQKA